MNKKKTIALKDPRLRAIRNSLREVINLSVTGERNRLFETMHKEDKNNVDGYKKFCELHSKRDALNSTRRDSTIRCPACNYMDRDVRYNPYDSAWYCVDCYKLIGDMYHVTMAKKERGEYIETDYNEEFARSFAEQV